MLINTLKAKYQQKFAALSSSATGGLNTNNNINTSVNQHSPPGKDNTKNSQSNLSPGKVENSPL